MHHPTDRIAHTTAFVTPVVEHWLFMIAVNITHNLIISPDLDATVYKNGIGILPSAYDVVPGDRLVLECRASVWRYRSVRLTRPGNTSVGSVLVTNLTDGSSTTPAPPPYNTTDQGNHSVFVGDVVTQAAARIQVVFDRCVCSLPVVSIDTCFNSLFQT